MTWQLRAARVLTDLVERGDREGLPVLEWTISHTGAQVTGRSYAQPGAARRAALAAWAAVLGIKLGEEYHQDSRMTTITGTANRERTRHGFAAVVPATRLVIVAGYRRGQFRPARPCAPLARRAGSA